MHADSPACSLLCGSLKQACENTAILLGGGSGSSDSSTSGLDGVVMHPLANDTAGSANSLLGNLLTWWLDMPSIDLNGTGALGLRPIALYLATVVAIVLAIGQAIRTVITRKGTPLLEVAEGVVKLALWVAISETLLGSLLAASDALTQWIARLGFGTANAGAVSTAFTARSLGALPSGDWLLVIILALVMIVVGLVQMVLLFVRQAAIPIQATLVPIAAAGQIGGPNSTPRRWLPKLQASIAAVILYKPMAMFVIAVGYREMAQATGMAQCVLGLVTLVLSIIALPSMIRLFAPLVGAAQGGGSGAGLLAVAGEALMLRRMSGVGHEPQAAAPTGAAAQAAAMNASGPAANAPTGTSPSPGSAVAGGTSGATPSGAAGQGTTAGGNTGAATSGGQGASGSQGAPGAQGAAGANGQSAPARRGLPVAGLVLGLKAADAVRQKAGGTASEWSQS